MIFCAATSEGVTIGSSVTGSFVIGGVVSEGSVTGGMVSLGFVVGASGVGGAVVSTGASVVGCLDVSGMLDSVVSGVEVPVELSSVDGTDAVVFGTDELSPSGGVTSDVVEIKGVTVEEFGVELFD